MTIYLPEDLERFVHDAVRAGRYAREDDVIRDALIRLRQAMPEEADTSPPDSKPAPSPTPQITPMTEQELKRHMLNIGLMTQLPDIDADYDDPDDQPIDIEGEPLSETVIRERR
jgi:Arc/MetJ-type ribon-helix-helix transcriptional regulator